MPHPHTINAREQKYNEAIAIGISEERISELVDTFYDRIRGDEILGPIFNEIITDWPPHLARMKDFWASIAIESGRFHGNPMVKHLAIPGIDQTHFTRWLALFNATLPDVFPNSNACQFLSDRAARIADSLMTGISIHHDGLPTIRQKNASKKEKLDVAR